MSDSDGDIIEKTEYDIYGRITKFEYWDTDHFEEATKTEGFVTAATYYSSSLTANPYLFSRLAGLRSPRLRSGQA